ncbi:hypothetical protein I7I51_03672 [Histoplasma capsulatum]|uniref:Uncharacterized protein n=1 Tax=Ajellomyces capsulatus TaxID=5037 RepID=A0A8A1MBG3_AJECA|nr:hypothetical protein I7I51_03672 [Histoplasma capsulatum]
MQTYAVASSGEIINVDRYNGGTLFRLVIFPRHLGRVRVKHPQDGANKKRRASGYSVFDSGGKKEGENRRKQKGEKSEKSGKRADVPGLINTQAVGARIAGGSQLGRRRQSHPWTWTRTLDGEHSPFPVRAGSPLLGGPFGLAGPKAGCGLRAAVRVLCVCLYIWPEARPGTAVGTYSRRLIPRFPTEVTGSRSTLVPLPSPVALDAIGCLGPLGIGPNSQPENLPSTQRILPISELI